MSKDNTPQQAGKKKKAKTFGELTPEEKRRFYLSIFANPISGYANPKKPFYC